MCNLTSGNCGCGTTCGNNNGIFGGSCIWILLLLFCGGNSCGNGCGNGILGNSDNNGCDWLIWILLISCICGNGSGCGNNGGCGNSCGNSSNSNNCGCSNSCC